jgi:TonB family protein
MRRIRLIVLLPLLAAIVASAQSMTSVSDAPVPFDQWAAKKISRPVLLNHVDVDYPDDTRIKNIDGICGVSVILNAQGDLKNPRIVHCNDSLFEESALATVKQYRFKPATTQDGNPIAVTFTVIVKYRVAPFLSVHELDKLLKARTVSMGIRYGFIPQGGGASNPDSDGVYPYTRSVTGPRVIKFVDRGYGREAFLHEGGGVCDVLLTITTKGKAEDPQVTKCERPELEEPAVRSLLKSTYKPGMVEGLDVPMRASIHLVYGDDQASWTKSSQ